MAPAVVSLIPIVAVGLMPAPLLFLPVAFFFFIAVPPVAPVFMFFTPLVIPVALAVFVGAAPGREGSQKCGQECGGEDAFGHENLRETGLQPKPLAEP
jgi:hypothetical protein